MKQQRTSLVLKHGLQNVGVNLLGAKKNSDKRFIMWMAAERRAFHNRLQVGGTNQRAGLG